MRRFFIYFSLLILVAVAGWRIYSGVKGSGQGRERTAGAVAIEVTPLKKSSIREVLNLTGSLTPRREFIAAAKVPGRVVQLLVDLGDEVILNQLVAVIDDEEYALGVKEAEAQLLVARAALNQSRSELKVARREFERTRALKEKSIISESDFDLAQSSLKASEAGFKVAEAQLKQKEAALKSAQVLLSDTRVLASWEEGEGPRTIGRRFVDEGALVRANDPIVSILDINTLVAVVNVVEADYFRIRIGQEAQISTDALPGRTFTGRITRIAPLLEETTREARVELEVPNSERELRPGMYIRAEIVLDLHPDATLAPVSALVRRDGSIGLFLLNPDRASVRFTPVKVGIINADQAEIIEPDLAGWVVTLGQHLLHDGSPVILGEDSGTAGPDRAASGPAPPAGR